jgi:hypothetical protein
MLFGNSRTHCFHDLALTPFELRLPSLDHAQFKPAKTQGAPEVVPQMVNGN